jgi:hypothetical protein
MKIHNACFMLGTIVNHILSCMCHTFFAFFCHYLFVFHDLFDKAFAILLWMYIVNTFDFSTKCIIISERLFNMVRHQFCNKYFNLLSKIMMNCLSKHYQLCTTFAWLFWHNLLVFSHRLFDNIIAMYPC